MTSKVPKLFYDDMITLTGLLNSSILWTDYYYSQLPALDALTAIIIHDLLQNWETCMQKGKANVKVIIIDLLFRIFAWNGNQSSF